MKPDKIYSIFRKVPMISLYNKINKDGEISKQYISNGVLAYLLDGLPTFSEHTLPSLVGFDKDKEVIVHEDIAPDFLLNMMSESERDGDIALKVDEFEFFDCIVMRSFDDKGKQVLHFIDPVYIKPFLNDENILFISRVTSGGERCVVIRYGFFVLAAVMPKVFPHGGYIDLVASIHTELIRQKNCRQDEQVGEME